MAKKRVGSLPDYFTRQTRAIEINIASFLIGDKPFGFDVNRRESKRYTEYDQLVIFSHCNLKSIYDFINISMGFLKEWSSYYGEILGYFRFRHRFLRYANFYCDINVIACDLFHLVPLVYPRKTSSRRYNDIAIYTCNKSCKVQCN